MILRSVRAPLSLALLLAAGPVLAQPKADPTPEATKLINARQRDLLATCATAKGVTVQQICERYKVSDLLKLTVADAKEEMARIEKLEPANA